MIAAAITVASAFNLVCSLDVLTAEMPSAHQVKTHRATVLRVDTIRKSWCEDACEASRPIVKLLDRQIVLIEQPKGFGADPTKNDGAGSFFEVRTVDRETGIYSDNSGIVGGMYKTEVGTCRVATFTGLPRKLF